MENFKSISNAHLSLSLLLVCSYIPVVPSKTIHDSQNQKGQKTIPLYKGVLPPGATHPEKKFAWETGCARWGGLKLLAGKCLAGF